MVLNFSFRGYFWGLGFTFQGIRFTFTRPTSLPSLLYSYCALLSRYRWRINKVSNIKVHKQTCSHCQKLKVFINVKTLIMFMLLLE